MGLYTMIEWLSESGRSHCRNRHVTNSYLCYQCYWLPIRISPPKCTFLPSLLSLSIASLALFQICKSDDILYRIMGYVRRINYTMPRRLGAERRSDSQLRAPRALCLQIYLSTVTNARQLKKNVAGIRFRQRLCPSNAHFCSETNKFADEIIFSCK